jgi:hypothetical protein
MAVGTDHACVHIIGRQRSALDLALVIRVEKWSVTLFV